MVIVTDRRVKIWRQIERELTEPSLWPAVEAVAKALLEKKTLRYDEAKQLYEATAYRDEVSQQVDQDLSARLRDFVDLNPELSMRLGLDAKQAEDAKVAA